jgi:hypothetical protein
VSLQITVTKILIRSEMQKALLIFIAVMFRVAISYEIIDEKWIIIKVIGIELGKLPLSDITEVRMSSLLDMSNLGVLNLSNKIFTNGLGIFVKSKRKDFLEKFIFTPSLDQQRKYILIFQKHSLWSKR